MQVVGVAEDGPGALIARQQLVPDVILLDMSLPGLSEIEVASEPPLDPTCAGYHARRIRCRAITETMDKNGYSYLLKSNPAKLAQAIRASMAASVGHRVAFLL